MWKAEFDEILSRDTAATEAKRLIDFFLTLAEEQLELAGLTPQGRDTVTP